MFNQADLEQISKKGITEEQITYQLEHFKNGFPYLKINATAAPDNGIIVVSEAKVNDSIECWQNYLSEHYKVVKFVPASGAASRMFKDLFAFLNEKKVEPTNDIERDFFLNINRFAFFEELSKKCLEKTGKDIEQLISENKFQEIISCLLLEDGLNYGQLPKGLLTFHRYDDGVRIAMEEHLVEAALYASSNHVSHIHFTISHDHYTAFVKKVNEILPHYEGKYKMKYEISFSEQKPATDTIAVNLDNTPFRNSDGSLLFRPGGHGALIENLNDIDSDVVFIKNIDNVVPDHLKEGTVKWKQVLAGYLVNIQKKSFAYLEQLEQPACSRKTLEEALVFVEHEMNCRVGETTTLSDQELQNLLIAKLNRPIRVCGMVKNQGEPGGGPFWIENTDGSISLQILEESQVNKNDEHAVDVFKHGTHFNPVDIVCSLKDYKGHKFDLTKYIDKEAGFISSKSKNGKDLKALELPGLWNGAMSDWNTVFIEVPIETFNPVKMVNDLLRSQHQ